MSSHPLPQTPVSPQKQRQFKHLIITIDDDRFNPDKPRQKRQRISVACSECSTRKVKCSGSRPKCRACNQNNATCTYRERERTAPAASSISGDNNISNHNNDFEDEGVAHSTPDNRRTSQIQQVHTPDTISSQAEYSATFDNWSAVNLHSNVSDYPLMVSITPPPGAFQSYHHTPNLGPRWDSYNTTKVRIPYFRWFGPTGIVPGFTKVLVDLRQAGSEGSASPTSSPPKSVFPPTPHFQNGSGSYETLAAQHEDQRTTMLFDDDDEVVPKVEVLEHLLQLFFDHFGCHFPFYQRDHFMESARSKSAPAVLLNCMCALASRFSQHPQIRREPIYLCGEIFGNKAKQLIVVLLAVPSYDLIASLLMLSWYEFGCNRDVGFWMYTGMAIRMAQDLGMHKGNDEGSQDGKASTQEGELDGGREDSGDNGESGRAEEEEQEEEDSLQLNLFWSIYFIDRIISLGTGRPLTLRDEQISCPLPTDGTSQSNGYIWPSPFPHMIRIMTIQGKANEEISTIRKPEDLTLSKRNILFSLQDKIIQIYTNLDTRLSFSVCNFRRYVALGLGGSFLLLHIWFHAVIITLHRPGLMFGKETLAHTLGSESLEVSMSSANTITSILTLAELIDEKTITGNPFLNQAIYIAGLAFIAESEMHGLNIAATVDHHQGRKPPQDDTRVSVTNDISRDIESAVRTIVDPANQTGQAIPPVSRLYVLSPSSFPTTCTPTFKASPASSVSFANTASSSLLQSASKRNYETCLHAITTLKVFWRGIGWILSTMEQKAKGIVQTDPSEESVDPESKIDLKDTGMLRRLLAVKKRRASRGSQAVLFQPEQELQNSEAWEMSQNQGCSSWGLAQNGVGIGDTWVDLAWVDPLDPTEGFNSRQDESLPDAQSRIWAPE